MVMRFQRLGAGAVATTCLTLTVAYLAIAYWIVFVTRIGPVAVVIDASAGHGVHAGDTLALPLVVMAGFSFVLGVAALDTALRRRPATPWRTYRAPAPVVAVDRSSTSTSSRWNLS